MFRQLAQRFTRSGAKEAPAAPADEPPYVEGVDYDFNLNRNSSSSGYGVAKGDMYINRRGFLKQGTSDALHELLDSSHSDARASLERLVRWSQPVDKRGKPIEMTLEERQGHANDVDRIVKYIAARQQPLVTGEKKGLGKIFYVALGKAMKELGTEDPVALLSQFDTLPENVRNHFSPTERDALSFEKIREAATPIAKEYVQLQKLSLALREDAAATLGEAMQPKAVHAEPLGNRSSAGFIAKEKPRTGMNGGSGRVVQNGHLGSGNGPGSWDR